MTRNRVSPWGPFEGVQRMAIYAHAKPAPNSIFYNQGDDKTTSQELDP